MTNSNNFHGGQKYLLSPRMVMATEILLNEEISGGGKDGKGEGFDSAICQRRANRRGIYVK